MKIHIVLAISLAAAAGFAGAQGTPPQNVPPHGTMSGAQPATAPVAKIEKSKAPDGKTVA